MNIIIQDSTIDPIPDTLLKQEVERMIEELSKGLEERGMNKEQYFADLQKKPEDIQKDFLPQAEFRLKAALVLRAIAKSEHIEGKDPTEINVHVFELLKKTCLK
jgi:FKBP-type peptidyl-prolyl cis-trans isomerase (trigger factor)